MLKSKKEIISVWVPRKYEGAKKLFKRFRDLGFTVCSASVPNIRDPILWYRDEVHEGEDRINRFEEKWRKKEKNNG